MILQVASLNETLNRDAIITSVLKKMRRLLAEQVNVQAVEGLPTVWSIGLDVRIYLLVTKLVMS